jgi:hypothetical protein
MLRRPLILCLILFACSLMACNLGVAPPVGVATRSARLTQEAAGLPPIVATSNEADPALQGTATALAISLGGTPIPATPIRIQSISPGIGGIVWHDLCAQFEDCNGVRDSGEVGVAGVQVSLYEGACPPAANEPAFRQQITGRDGTYRFDDLNPGTYCVEIAEASPANMLLLAPGAWSHYPAGGQESAGAVAVTIPVAREGSPSDVDFGWDFGLQP